MQEKETSTLKLALHYGCFLGLYWMLEYAILYILIGGGYFQLLCQYLMSVGTFLLIYIFILKWKNSIAKPINLLQYIKFAILICIAASAFEGTLMYAHFKFIDPGYFVELSNLTKDMMTKILDIMPNVPRDESQIDSMIVNKGYYIASLFFNNIILGIIIGLISGLLLNSNITKTKNHNY